MIFYVYIVKFIELHVGSHIEEIFVDDRLAHHYCHLLNQKLPEGARDYYEVETREVKQSLNGLIV